MIYTAHVTKHGHDKKNPTHIYIGRAMPRHGLKASPLANPYSVKKYSVENSLILYGHYVTAKLEAIKEIFRLKKLYEKHGELTLFCWCKKEVDDDTPCHGDVIKGVLMGMIGGLNDEL